jgi:HK97 family phage prohead protease
MTSETRECRSTHQTVALEAREEGKQPIIQGYAALFDNETEIRGFFGSFRESIAPGAFAPSLSGGHRVVSLFNHDANMVLGSTSSGTMRLREDDRGLWIEVDPPDTQVGRDVVEYIRRGDVQGQSFMFEITREEWQFSEDPKVLDKRVIQEVRLYEAGPVLFPAYPETSVGVRSTADLAYERARRQWEERNRPEKPVVIVSPDPFLLRVRVLRAA